MNSLEYQELKRPESGGIILEEAAKVIGGVAGELVIFYAIISAGIFDAAWLRAD